MALESNGRGGMLLLYLRCTKDLDGSRLLIVHRKCDTVLCFVDLNLAVDSAWTLVVSFLGGTKKPSQGLEDDDAAYDKKAKH